MIITIPTFPSKEVALFFVQRRKKVKKNKKRKRGWEKKRGRF